MTTEENQKIKMNSYPPFIDTDVHSEVRSEDDLKQFLPAPWRDRYRKIDTRKNFVNPVSGMRNDSWPPGGGKPGSDPDFLRKQLIESYPVEYAILMSRGHCNMVPDPDYGNAIASAVNNYYAEYWLDKWNWDGVFKGSIMVNTNDPQGAVKEIERWAGHPHFVQVFSDAGSRMLLGQRYYWPIYEACARHNLPFALHPSTEGQGINAPTSAGYPTRYIEWKTDQALGYQATLVSFITEGVFEQYPALKLVLIEGGVTWLPSLMWRLEANWKALRVEVPWMKRRPQDYVRDHVRFSTQPIDTPDDWKQLLQMLNMLDAENLLMFATDYPHWDFDDPDFLLPRLPEPLRSRVAVHNARELYGLKPRVVTHIDETSQIPT